MFACISEATTMHQTFAEDVAAYAGAGFTTMEVWLTKLETHLQSHPGTDTLHMLEDRAMTLAAAAYQGGLLLSDGEARRTHFDHFRRRLDLCALLGIPTLLLVADFTPAVDAPTLEKAVAALARAGEMAAALAIRLALEFRGRSAFCSSLDTAVALAARCGQPNVGVALDLFHYYTGPSKFEDLGLLTPDNLFHVQVCDLPGIPRELATDADRVLPGDGVFQLIPILRQVRARGYDACISLELMNPRIWQGKPAQTAEIGLAALDRLFRAVDDDGSGAATPSAPASRP